MNESKWIQLQRMIGLNPATPLPSQEGQIRYSRDGDVNGALYVARGRVGGTLEWGQLITSNIAANLTATGADPTITNTPVGDYPSAGNGPTALSVLGNDTCFRVTFTTGAGPVPSDIFFHVEFAVPRSSSNYDVWFTSDTAAAGTLAVTTTNRATTGFDVRAGTLAPAAGAVVGWGCLVIGY